METLDVETLPFEEKQLFQPSLEEARDVLSSGLQKNFKIVNVEIVDCPDLRNAPFHLASEGICGKPTLLEFGGVPYLLPLVDRSKLYDLRTISQKVANLNRQTEFFLCGAGAGPFPLFGKNIEGIFNFSVDNGGNLNNQSHIALVDEQKQCSLQKVTGDDTRAALLGNVLISEGKPGKVLKVHCKIRIGSDDFIASIRKTLAEQYSQTVGLGGVFVLKQGKAKQHVMQDFSKTPINTEEELNTWLKFYEMPAELIALGILITDEADLDLRLQHFHSFSKQSWGGHYHIDVTPDTVEYEGYFSIGEKIVRVDKPVVTHKFGRD